MFTSFLISLTPTTSVPILGALGRPTQAWFLNQVMLKRPRLAEAMHDDQGYKPFAVSTLLDPFGRPIRAGEILHAGQDCWLRVTTIGEELSEFISQKVFGKLPPSLTIYKMGFRINGFTLNPREHGWAGESSFAEIAQDSAYVKAPRELRLEFVTPTAFRNTGKDIALPDPGHVFRSLSEKWNAFCPESMRLDERWPAFARDCILVSEMTAVNTVHWEFAEGTRGAATGFTGTVGFSLLPQAKVKKQWQPYWAGADVVMQSLARFAFYSGTGHHTTIGMGQTRLVSPSAEKTLLRGRDQVRVQEKRRYGYS